MTSLINYELNEFENNIMCTSPEIREVAKKVTENLLPNKSREKYEKQYKSFQDWCTQNAVELVSEKCLLTYFDMLSKHKKSSTLWSTYSILKSCLNVYQNIDISKYLELQTFLKRISSHYEPKKSKILQVQDIDNFVAKADDKFYLVHKVSFI